MDSRMMFTLMGAGVLIFALYRIGTLIDIYMRRSASASWQSVTGKILSKKVSVRRGSKGGTSYVPEITYTYSVMGDEYKKTISLGSKLRQSHADEALDEIGETLEIRFHPEKPKVHISEEEKIRFNNLFEAFLLIFIGLIFLYVSLSGIPISSGHMK